MRGDRGRGRVSLGLLGISRETRGTMRVADREPEIT